MASVGPRSVHCIGSVVVATVCQSGVGDVDVALAVRGALLRHRLASCVCQGLGLLEFRLRVALLPTCCTHRRLCLHQTKIVLLRRSRGTRRVRIDRCSLRCGRCTSILDDKVGAELVATHVVHGGQLAARVLGPRDATTRRARACVAWSVHDVGEVHPLVTISVSVLRRVRLRARHLTHSQSLRMVRPHKHWRLAMPSRA